MLFASKFEEICPAKMQDFVCFISGAYTSAKLVVGVKDFESEVLWDMMLVNGQNYSGSTGPVDVDAVDGRISCFSDGAGRQISSSIYVATPAPKSAANAQLHQSHYGF